MRPALSPRASPSAQPLSWWTELQAREPTLAWLTLGMLLAAIPTAVALGLDERLFRGVSLWAKPLKFMLSLALFAATTAWFIDLLPRARRQRRGVRIIVWTLLVASVAEVGYITLQAALGQASHYNQTDLLHMALYQLMGVGALSLMLTQPLLAWLIVRHGRTDIHPLWRETVVLALCMTFVLGVGAAGLLASAQPPAGPGLPVLGWHLGGGDLRPAHFIGSHAQQFVPLAGWLLLCTRPGRARVGLWLFAAAYTALWLTALLRGLSGAVWMVPV